MDVSGPSPVRPGASRFAPWAALFAALSGELMHHQVLSDMLRYDCRLGEGRVFLLAGAGVIAWMALGAWVSWHAVRADDAVEARAGARRFIAQLGLLAAALLAVAVAWQTFAGFVVPACGT